MSFVVYSVPFGKQPLFVKFIKECETHTETSTSTNPREACIWESEEDAERFRAIMGSQWKVYPIKDKLKIEQEIKLLT